MVADYGLTARQQRSPSKPTAAAQQQLNNHMAALAASPESLLSGDPLSPQSASTGDLSLDLGLPPMDDPLATEVDLMFLDIENGFVNVDLLLPHMMEPVPGFGQPAEFPALAAGAFPPPTPDAAACFNMLSAPCFAADPFLENLKLLEYFDALVDDSQQTLAPPEPARLALKHVIPLSKGRRVTADPPAPSAETHFVISKGLVVLKRVDGHDMISNMFTVAAEPGHIIKRHTIRVLAYAPDAAPKDGDAAPAERDGASTPTDAAPADAVALVEFAAPQPPKADSPTETINVAVFQRNSHVAVSSIAVSASLVLARADDPADDAAELHETHHQVFFIKESIPTKRDVEYHLRLLLGTAYRQHRDAARDAWRQALAHFDSCVALDLFRQALKTALKPAGWIEVSAELHGLDFTLTPQELYRGVQWLLTEELKVDLSDEAAAETWGTLLQAISNVTKTASVNAILKDLDAPPKGLSQLRRLLLPCRDVVVAAAAAS